MNNWDISYYIEKYCMQNMISKFWLNLTFLVFTVKYAALEEVGVSDCSTEEPHYRYLVYPGEIIFFNCSLPTYKPIQAEENTIQWFYQKSDGSLEEVKSKNNLNLSVNGAALQISPLERKNSGTYMCRMKNVCMKMIVHVEDMESCPKYGPKSLFFRTIDIVSLSCPSINCYQGQNITNVTWYKTEKFLDVLSPDRFFLTISNNNIQFSTMYVEDTAIYTCDYNLPMNGKEWIVRATINVSVDVPDTQNPPDILDPTNGTEIKAELGKPFNLKCRIRFGYERSFNPLIKWRVVHPEVKEKLSGGRSLCSNTDYLKGYICNLAITLDTVTDNDLHKIFECYAQNTVGNITTTVKLSKKEKDVVFLIYVLCISVVGLVIVLVGAGAVYVYWIEIVLFYRHYMSKDETVGDNKDFDAFISYATQTSEFSEETTEYSFNYEDERFATQLLPSVLEDNYNYKLCILQRDILPGGAYVEDIAKIIKKSRRAIFILSQRYITGPSLFELEAAVKCSLEEQESLKLILIKMKPFKEPETIPHIVKKALRAVPTVAWKGDLDNKSAHTTKFWKRIRYYMPVKKTRKM
ncbi:interleukin-18 receptor accessory protein [Eleutherodactylus coqui]|uniref:interleukin-18 receptor accessory protein n=1 Tax=Eleutherodactylus coqui TaxID=57060 RepID=UPI00346229A0